MTVGPFLAIKTRARAFALSWREEEAKEEEEEEENGFNHSYERTRQGPADALLKGMADGPGGAGGRKGKFTPFRHCATPNVFPPIYLKKNLF